jgi:hypothetical protein
MPIRSPSWTCSALLALSLTGAATAQESGVLVELYTSQGCSSCPPADAMLADLAALDGVIPLALHVDYWDYIGWPDDFAQAAFTARQERYAMANGERTVFTPQFRIGGTDSVVGADAAAVMAALRAHAQLPPTVDLQARDVGGMLEISAIRLSGSEPLMLQLASYVPQAAREILGGENNGRTITYTHVVTDWVLAARWEGADALAVQVPRPGDGPVVIILQQDGPGLVRAALRLD